MFGKPKHPAPATSNNSLKVNEIFYSIQGESRYAGLPCIFIRLAGCNLRCAYCDTQYAYEEGNELSVQRIVQSVACFPTRLVEITGGEPLLQAHTPQLLSRFADAGFTVLLETNGTLSLEPVDERVIRIMDIKCPDSGMSEHMLWDNIERLRSADEVKLVISSRGDYDWALGVVEKYELDQRCSISLSPAQNVLEARKLAEWMLEDAPATGKARLQLQIHKYIWPERERGV